MAQGEATIRTWVSWEHLPWQRGEEKPAWGQETQKGHWYKVSREEVMMTQGLVLKTLYPNAFLLDTHRKKRITSKILGQDSMWNFADDLLNFFPKMELPK